MKALATSLTQRHAPSHCRARGSEEHRDCVNDCAVELVIVRDLGADDQIEGPELRHNRMG
eukprot:CAMPEP_0172630638 /NCGR_PEP_ID=MMETSP1068-20121228/174709_1 /TAXON_ID=35684 /ORGANISM="Pseudopedinella elastica, Strain CCMP716" /LENGTH=59 /DNA_ID=CAMNT_0013441537 /DNA_START=365 /DNA_END=544 /DNA_ORIENTATION=+